MGIIVLSPLLLIIVTAPIGVTICGIVAVSKIRHSGGRLYGIALAMFDALFFPLLALEVLLALAILALVRALWGNGDLLLDYKLVSMIWLPLCLMLDAAIYAAALRAAKRPPASAASGPSLPPVAPATNATFAPRSPSALAAMLLFLAGLTWLAGWGYAIHLHDTSNRIIIDIAGFGLIELLALFLGIRAWRRGLGKAVTIMAALALAGAMSFVALYAYDVNRASRYMTVTGQVLDSQTQQPIPCVSIVPFSPGGEDGTFTDRTGFFDLQLRRDARYNIVLTAPGYASQTFATLPNIDVNTRHYLRPVDPADEGFSPFVNSLITPADVDSQGLVFVNLQTGARPRPPMAVVYLNGPSAGTLDVSRELGDWIAANGVDLVVHMGPLRWEIVPLGLQIEAAPSDERTTSRSVRDVIEAKDPQHLHRPDALEAGMGLSLTRRIEHPIMAWDVFRTRDNAAGLIGLAAYDRSDALLLRYRFVKGQPTTATPGPEATRAPSIIVSPTSRPETHYGTTEVYASRGFSLTVWPLLLLPIVGAIVLVIVLAARKRAVPVAAVPPSVLTIGLAQQAVRIPAIGLVLCAAINLVAVWLFAMRMANTNELAWRVVLSIAAAVAWNLVILLGAVGMIRLKGYGLAIAGSIMALPAVPGAILGLPFGIWALIVLSRREVKDAFAASRFRAAPPMPTALPSSTPRRLFGPALGTTFIHTVLLSILVALASFLFPRYIDIFKNMGVALPEATQFAVNLGMLFHPKALLLLMPLVLVLDCGVCLLLQAISPVLRRIWSILITLALVVVAIVATFGILYPMGTLTVESAMPPVHATPPATVTITGFVGAASNDPSGWYVAVSVQDSDNLTVVAGQRVQVKVDAFPGRTFEGEVSLVGNKVLGIMDGPVMRKVAYAPVSIKVLDPDPNFERGLGARVTFIRGLDAAPRPKQATQAASRLAGEEEVRLVDDLLLALRKRVPRNWAIKSVYYGPLNGTYSPQGQAVHVTIERRDANIVHDFVKGRGGQAWILIMMGPLTFGDPNTSMNLPKLGVWRGMGVYGTLFGGDDWPTLKADLETAMKETDTHATTSPAMTDADRALAMFEPLGIQCFNASIALLHNNDANAARAIIEAAVPQLEQWQALLRNTAAKDKAESLVAMVKAVLQTLRDGDMDLARKRLAEVSLAASQAGSELQALAGPSASLPGVFHLKHIKANWAAAELRKRLPDPAVTIEAASGPEGETILVRAASGAIRKAAVILAGLDRPAATPSPNET